MRAIGYQLPSEKSSPPAVVEIEVPDPEPSPGSVMVQVAYAGLSNFERETSEGRRNPALARLMKRLPVVSGIEMSGVVTEGSTGFEAGDRVVAYTNILRGPFFHADYVAVPEFKLTTVPDNVSLAGAASLVGGALTAIAALERIADVRQGQEVLITGATGSVGITAVQLAAYLGARVSAVCHSSQADFAIAEGAAATFAYDREELPEANNQFDAVFDTAPSLGFSTSTDFLRARGTYITTMPHLDIPGFFASLLSRRKWGYLMEADTDSLRMTRLQELMAVGAFHEVVDSIYPLAEASAAFAHQLERRRRGKILIDFNGSAGEAQA